MELSEIRTRIDAVDNQLLKLFLERMELAEEVRRPTRTSTICPF